MKLYYAINPIDGVAFYETSQQAPHPHMEADIPWAVNVEDRELQDLRYENDRLEMEVIELREELPSDEHKAILEALDDAKYNGQPGILKHLSATTNAIADEYGYTSPEYAAICAITNAIAQ
jgi:hypothetical protein